MREKTFQKLKEEFPVVATAAAVSLLSYILYFATSRGILSTMASAFYAMLYSAVAVGIIYLFLWVEYRITNRTHRIFRRR